ncbi:hypothetical protein PIL02S_02126 [Paenibacillus illinoisensis]|uniref:Uncharacterized protein n=1 Tax=Paenibacillus illinoisensis TaxID=59845 RepID=A0A2W0CGL4_9BACL|nr:hypothetical protein PIL02S_02126 [Paenibacillus illinoisensis]
MRLRLHPKAIVCINKYQKSLAILPGIFVLLHTQYE